MATTSRFGADAEVVVEEPRELADRHAVAHRDRIQPDERLESRNEHRAFDVHAANRVRPIADDDLQAVLARGLRQLAIV